MALTGTKGHFVSESECSFSNQKNITTFLPQKVLALNFLRHFHKDLKKRNWETSQEKVLGITLLPLGHEGSSDRS